MSVRWKFWKRSKGDDTSVALDAPSPGAWLPLMSGREILGLQRTIGNQAVLELMAARSPARSVTPPASGHWFLPWKHKPRRV